MALLQITVTPLGTGATSVSGLLAPLETRLAASGLPYQITDMATIVEGEPAALWRLAAELHQIPFDRGALRVVTTCTMDERRDRQVQLGDKVRSLAQAAQGG